MKAYSLALNIVVVLVGCMLPAMTLKAQFLALPDSAAIWNFRMYDTWQGLFDDRRTYLLSGQPDTTINGLAYRSLTWYWDTGTWPGDFGGALRESGSGQVFYYHPNTDQEYLLYDFDVSAGDTIHGIWVVPSVPAFGDTTTMYISGVDTISIGGQERKRIGVQNLSSMGGPSRHWWIQGIGGSDGLLETIGEPILDVVYGIECMSSNDTVWWAWGPVGAPGHCSPNSIVERGEQRIAIFPNPSTGSFNIAFTAPLLRESYYGVYDATGRLLLQRPLPTGATLGEVDLSRFGRGAYVLRVIDPVGVRHERVVVQ